ncbi:MAG TPA: zf-HC2 domain-containing protein [Steroidobacter sp.]
MPANHEHCWELIPWVVNGRASDVEQRAVLAHIETCAECREELQRHRALQSHMRGNDDVIAAPNASWQKLLTQIDTQPQTEVAEARRSKRPWLIAALWLQLVAIAALAGALFTSVRQPEYQTLSTPEVTDARAAVRVVFAPDASVNRVNELLRQVQGNIMAGPSEAGVYTLSAPAGKDVQAIIVTLRAHPEVLFAEPSQASAGSDP